ncbi:glycoside hydrolase family 25 protein [Cohnella sp. GCM10012308]|uniref:glycoside hydrolase family 25 protein n=1 Tax=Cohnella sp. GCM10012308 TaxID=3317329 RepID=UPI00361045DA
MQKRSNNNAEGIDVSHHNGIVDWAKVAADGISFAFLKASEGKSFRDNMFAGHLKEARAVGLLVGAYHFVGARSEADAKAEAANFAGAISAAGGVQLLDLPPVMDYENNPGNLKQTQINAVAMAFLGELERLTGRRPMVYTGNAFGFNFGPLLASYPLWIARYSATIPPDNNQAWREWTIWQYSDGSAGGTRKNGTRKVSGVSGNVDLNEYTGTLADLQLAFGRKPASTAAEIVPKVVRMEGNVVITTGEIVDGRLVAPIAEVLKAAGVPFAYDNETKKLYLL